MELAKIDGDVVGDSDDTAELDPVQVGEVVETYVQSVRSRSPKSIIVRPDIPASDAEGLNRESPTGVAALMFFLSLYTAFALYAALQSLQDGARVGAGILCVLAGVSVPIMVKLVKSLAHSRRDTREYGPDRWVWIESSLAVAWWDWTDCLRAIRELGCADEAYSAMADEDLVLRRALELYRTQDQLSESEAKEFRDWFQNRCAKGRVLYQMELDRVQLFKRLPDTHELRSLMREPERLSTAAVSSRALHDAAWLALESGGTASVTD